MSIILYETQDNVVTQVELSDLLVEKGADDLDSVVMIQCVGSRNDENAECSRICCQSAVKNALKIKKLNPDAEVYIMYRDMRTFGLLEDYYTEARKKGVIFIRFNRATPPDVKTSSDGGLLVERTRVAYHRAADHVPLVRRHPGHGVAEDVR